MSVTSLTRMANAAPSMLARPAMWPIVTSPAVDVCLEGADAIELDPTRRQVQLALAQ